MPLIAWDNKYLTGNAEVDHQHQELFALINALNEAIAAGRGKEMVMPTLDRIAAYVVKHFRTEETLMQAQRYPGQAQHQAAHDQLARQSTEMIDDYRSGRLVLSITLARFLADWFRVHIMEEDFKMITWLKAPR